MQVTNVNLTKGTGRYIRLEERNFFDEILALRDRQRELKKTAEWVVKYDEVPWELNRQGYMKWYMAPTMDDIVMSTYVMYVQQIPARSRSGKQLTQGQQLGFIWKAKSPGGHSVIDGERYEWDQWDIVLIPIRTKGCVVQHFNDSDENIEILFCSLNQVHSAGVDRGSGFEQLEECPEYRQQAAGARATP
jgi:hypothetical protein